MKIARTWDSMPPTVQADGETFSTVVLHHKYLEMVKVAQALLKYIDAIPKELEITVTMPGVDRDWVDEVLADKA